MNHPANNPASIYLIDNLPEIDWQSFAGLCNLDDLKTEFERVFVQQTVLAEQHLAQRLQNSEHLLQRVRTDQIPSFQKDKHPEEGDANITMLAWLPIDKLDKTLHKFLAQANGEDWNPQTLAHQLIQWHPLSLVSKSSGPVRIDFLNGKKAHRRQFGGGMGQPLVKAMGRLEQTLPQIFDATAGLGGDSFVLASLGFEVTLCERNPIVSALLNDALTRAKLQNPHTDSALTQSLERMTLLCADSIDYLNAQEANSLQSVYLDPMYPEKKKSAATSKEMSALQEHVGADIDSQYLLEAAIHAADYRVIVKRPKGAAAIANDYQPTTEIKSPNTRYDIYVKKVLH